VVAGVHRSSPSRHRSLREAVWPVPVQRPIYEVTSHDPRMFDCSPIPSPPVISQRCPAEP
jgi:hypothetical protein